MTKLQIVDDIDKYRVKSIELGRHPSETRRCRLQQISAQEVGHLAVPNPHGSQDRLSVENQPRTEAAHI